MKEPHPYTIHYANTGDGKRYRIAIARLLEQGNGEARDAAQDLIDELAPTLVLVVGIAGASPLEYVKLGDVVVSTWIHDFTMEVRKTGQEPEDSVTDDIAHPKAHALFEYAGKEIKYFVTDGPIDKAMAAFVTNLAAYEDELGSWTMDLPPSPPVTWESDEQLYGPPDWQSELRAKLTYHYGTSATPGGPVYSAGPIAASNRFVKDPELLIPWLKTARDLRAIEMESAGLDRAIRERCPMLAIRGISDIIGLKRSDAWAKYACASAAAFTRAFLRTRPAGDPS